jgi:dienelactone hydrolase
MNPYSYPAVEPYFNLHLKETTRGLLRYAVDFPVAKLTRYYKESNTGRGELFLPREDFNGPLAILIHGWGDQSVIPCKLLAKALVKRGVATFILYLVFHSSRMPKVMKDKGLHLSPEEWFEGYQTSVVEIRQIVDWASSLRETDEEKIAVIGISLGGIIAAISMGVDKRISAGVFVVTGGNYENPAWLKEKRDTRKAVEYSEGQERYTQYLTEVAERGSENVTPPKKSYLTDPLTFAGYLRKRPIMMINALWDKSVPRQATYDFWEACGKPAIRWFPSTHASIWLFYPLISRQIVSFLRATFGM